MKSFVKQGILFLLAFCAVQVICNLFLFDHLSKRYYHNKHFSTKYQEYLKEAKDCNMIFLGSSRIYRQINPAIIDTTLKDKQIRSYNLGSPATFMPETFYLLDMWMQDNPNPHQTRYVVMELTGIMNIKWINWFSPQSYYYLDKEIMQLVAATQFGNHHQSLIQSIMDFYPFLQGWVFRMIMPPSIFIPTQIPVEYAGLNKDGYFPLEHEMETFHPAGLIERREAFLSDTTVLMHRKETQEKWKQFYTADVLVDYLNQMVQDAHQHNVEVFFVIPPKLKNYKAMAPLAERLEKGRVIDVGNPDLYPELNLVANNFDHGHFNQRGAAIFSKYLADKLKAELNAIAEGVQ